MNHHHRHLTRRPLLIALLAAAGLMLTGIAATGPDAPPAPDAAMPTSPSQDAPPVEGKRRVILFVNRTTTVMGYVEVDDDDMIIVRDRDGELHSYPKSRVLAIVYLVDPAEGGQPGTVYLRNGQERQGIIHEDAFDHVTIEIEGIRTKLRRDVVASVVLQPTLLERYERFKERMNPENIQQHYDLCSWLVEHKMWELAHKELTALLKKEKAGEAIELLRLVEAQLALMNRADKSVGAAGDDGDNPPPTADKRDPNRNNRRTDPQGPTRLLDPDEINLIRVYELDFADPPRLHITPDVIRQLITEYSGNELIPAEVDKRNALFRADPLDIVRLMFELKARHLYGEIEVLSDPPAIQKFHRYVHDAWLVRNCATSECHGGGDGGQFQLHRRRANTDRARYTNMLILERLEIEGAERPLVDYEEPYMSLIIQYALPRTLARLPHPEVDGWRPVFTRGNKELLQRSVEWMQSMMMPRPNYPIEFDPNKTEDEQRKADGDGRAPSPTP